MAKSFRQIVESVVFAGLKPGVPRSETQRMRWLGPYRQFLERFLSSAAPDDPFYLSNRTLGQRIRVWILVAIPVLLVAGVIAFGMAGFIARRDSEPKEFNRPRIAAKMLPDLNKPMNLVGSSNVEVLEARIRPGEPFKLVGSVRNLTDRTIGHTDLVFDLMDGKGSRLGAVSVPLDNIPPNQTTAFQLPIEQRTAAFALKRAE